MSQNVQLEQVMVDGMVVKMGRDDVRRHIVGRMLDGRKGIDLLAQGQDYDTARMLARGPADTGTALQEPFDLAVALMDLFPLKVVLYIPVGCFVRYRRDGAGLKSLAVAENNFRVFMGLTLVLT